MSTVARVNAEINLQDNLTRPLKEAEGNVRKFAERSRDELGRFTISASRAWKEFGDKLGNVSQKMQGAGLAMSAGLTAPLALFAKTAVDAAAKMESMRASMAAITGSSEAAQKQLEALEGMSKRTASSYDLLIQASKGLIAGFDGDVIGANAVLERFATLSNVMGVSRADFDRLVVNLTQIGGASRLTGDELREMASILPNLRSLLKQAFGTSQSEELAKMGITGRQALEGIAKAIDAKGFKANTETYNAQLQVLQTEFFKLKVAAGEALLPLARDIVGRLTPAFEKMAAAIKAMSPEQKRMIVNLGLVVAAAGPVVMALGAVGNAISGIIAAKGALSGVFTAFGRVLASSGGALGLVRTALAALTGPVGIAIALVTALYVAWQKNFLGIQDIVMPFVRRIGAMFRDLYDNIRETMEVIVETVVEWWKSIEPQVRPVLDFLVKLVQFQWTQQLRAVEAVFRFIIDAINVALATIQLISGRGWSQISDSMKASFMRMREIAWTIMANIAQAVLNAFKSLTVLAGVIPGVQDVYNGLINQAQGWIDSMKAEAKASGILATSYQNQADAARRLKDAQEAAARSRRQGAQGGASPFGPGAGGTGGGIGGSGGRTKAQDLTSEIVLAMGRAVESPGSRAAAACAFFASSVIAKFTKGVTDEGGRIQWNAANLVKVFRDRLGAAVVDAANARPGALAFRPGNGPSGVHVGIALGDGRVMDMNGQRDGRRNTLGISPASQWRGFLNVPDRFMDPKFKGGDVTEAFKAEFEAATRAAEEYARKLQAVQELQRELLVEQMRARGERLKDILSVQEFGKAYDSLTDPLNRARIDAMEALEAFRQNQEVQERERQLLKDRAEARANLNRQLIETANGYRRERELINATTEEERVRWEITNGGYREAHPLAQAVILAQARLLDQARAAKTAAENWKAFWQNLFQRAKEMQEEARKTSQEKYDEYVKRLTERMLELQGAQEQLLRQDLTEQFKGLFPEIRDTTARAAAIQKAVDDIINKSRLVAEAEQKMKFLQDLAKGMEDIFMTALDNMFENGFRTFFDDVIGGFRDMVREIAQEMIRLQIRRAIVWGMNQVFGAGTATMAGLFGGRAGGGFVHPGTPYVVGETGPEVFVPGSSGRVVPNYALGGGGGPVTNITVNLQTPNAQAFRKSEAQMVAEVFGRANRARMRDGRG